MSERELEAALRRVEPPEAEAAAERAWTRVEATLDAAAEAGGPRGRERPPSPAARGRGRPPSPAARGRFPRRFRPLPVLATLALAVVAALSPPGEALAEWLRLAAAPAPRAPERPPPVPVLQVPGGGALLVRSPEALWIVDERGRRHSLGRWDDAAWSPHGRFVAAVRGHELSALDRRGEVRWSLTRPYALAQPAWSPGDGQRIAYRSRDGLRVVAGDGTGDRLLAGPLGPAGPAWRPGARHQLAWADRRGRVQLADADTGRLRWRAPAGGPVRALAWAPAGRRLAVVTARGLRVLDARGRTVTRVRVPAGRTITAAAFGRRGRAPLAYAVHDARRAQTAVRIAPGRRRAGRRRAQTAVRIAPGRRRAGRAAVAPPDDASRRIFAGRGRIADLAFAPDGAWLLLGWRNADQWVLLGAPYVTGVAALRDVSRRFGARPRVRGWCCPP